MLVALGRYLQSLDRPASLTCIAQNLSLEPTVARHMLDHWIRKGCVEKRQADLCHQSCRSCTQDLILMYQWRRGH